MTDISIQQPWQPERIYLLLGKQVKSWHKHYRMGENSSVSTEMAGELLESVWYTLDCAGTIAGEGVEEALARGQRILAEKLERAKTLHSLVYATAPEDPSQCWFETVQELRVFLQRYDVLHFAHRVPLELFYPLLNPVPEGVRGIDYVLYCLNCLWMENQILHGFSEDALEELRRQQTVDFWDAPVNLCEQPLWNAVGHFLLGGGSRRLIFTEEQREGLAQLLASYSPDALEPRLKECAWMLCQKLELSAKGAEEYVLAAVMQLRPRLQAALSGGDLGWIFLG